VLWSWFDVYLQKNRRTEEHKEQKERKQAAAAAANMVFL